jgi:hypothetical protein
MKKVCECIEKRRCKSCSYQNGINIPALDYEYWNQTFWLNNATTDGWGATLGRGNQGLNTGDNNSGYGVSDTRGSGSNSKKLKRVYEYAGKVYESSSTLIFYNNRWIPIADIPDVKKSYRYVD